MSNREDDETREVATGEHPKMPAEKRTQLLEYFKGRQQLMRATKERIERQIKSGSWARSGIAADSLSKDLKEYETVFEEHERLMRLLYSMGLAGEI